MCRVVWQCRLLLGIVLLHAALSNPVVRRDVLAVTHDQTNPLAHLHPETLGEEAFGGPTGEKRSNREKRLLKTATLGALAVKGAKAVGAKVVTGAAKAVGAKVLKTGAVVKAVAGSAIGLKAKSIGVKAATAVAALGIKALLFKLLFGLSKSSLQPRQQKPTTPAVTDSGDGTESADGQVPEFDPNKISLQVPDELFAPAFNSVNSISTIVGNLIQNTAERVARLVERLKPLLRSSLGFRSRKRQTEKEEEKKKEDWESDDLGGDELSNSETTYFTDSVDEIQEAAGSETVQKTTADDAEIEKAVDDQGDNLHSDIKTSYTALVDNS